MVYRGATRSLLIAGAWGSAGVALLWLVTRTVGLPIGPHAGRPEAVGPLDTLATLDEQAIVLLVLALVRWPSLRPHVVRFAQRAGPAVGIGLTIASLVSLTLGVHAHRRAEPSWASVQLYALYTHNCTLDIRGISRTGRERTLGRARAGLPPSSS